MAKTIVTQLLVLSFALVQQQTTATQDGFMLLALSIHAQASNVTAPCLLRGQSPTVRRDDYTYMPGPSGYKLHTRALLWADARLVCQEEGGHLAIINSVAESVAIALLFRKSEPITGSEYPDDAYIGYHDFFREGEYVTIHGESLSRAGYDQWETGQPNGLGNQNCGGVHSSGRLNDLFCNKPFGYICEIPATRDKDDVGTSNIGTISGT